MRSNYAFRTYLQSHLQFSKRRTIVDIDQLITLSLFYTLSLCILVDFYMLGIGFYAIKHRFYGYKGKLG